MIKNSKLQIQQNYNYKITINFTLYLIVNF